MNRERILELHTLIDLALIALEDINVDLERYPANAILDDLQHARNYTRLLGFRAAGRQGG